ncbi:DUF885 family protein [Sphingosinicella sp. CPCC 101087]|uniref:DUF885 domain-containing protein n=1 Tax=Sphingosinicella sp. CPCC 101087 TaxID=2497754 RepID=UPI00101B98F1|nr:DUF885 family protein [Sphingosinicella sp. CPCC 101087]
MLRSAWKSSLALLLLSAVPLASASGQVPAAQAGSADARLRALYDAEWEWRSEEFGFGEDGYSFGGASLPSVAPEAQERRLRYWSQTLAQLERIPVDQLSPEEKINAAVFRTVLEAKVAELRYRDYEMPFRSGSSFWVFLAPRQGLSDAEAYRNYLGRMRDIPRYFDEQIANMRAGLERGFTPPRVTITGREQSILPFTESDVERNPFYLPFTQMPNSIPAAEQEALREQARALIAGSVAPAYAKLLPFIRDEYIPGARTTLAAEALPDGANYYRSLIREYTTLDLSGEQIHQIGLGEVARIRAEMDEVMRRSGWTGDFAGFLHFLKTDPRFVAKTPYEHIARATYIIKKVNGKLGETIGLLPRFRFTILPTPDAIAPFGTGGNGGLDSCWFNTHNLPAWKLYTLPALAVHECAPGHSFQAALALELEGRPPIRRNTYFSGYGEGWGLYTEWLGIGMGIYETPEEDFGRLSYEMWRACRLVIDTGIHQFGWTREQAIDYLASNTALSDHEVEREIDRYISGPGQALAYKLGEMLIRRKRAEAEAALGDRFDQRWFHDVILDLGSVPLPVLEEQIDLWIAGGGRNPHAPADTVAS